MRESAVPQAISPSRIETLKVRKLVSSASRRRMNGLERPGKKGPASMAQQAIDLAQQTNASSISRWLSGAGKSLLPAGCCLLVGLFYLSAFFPKHHAWEAATFIFVAWVFSPDCTIPPPFRPPFRSSWTMLSTWCWEPCRSSLPSEAAG